MTYVPVNRRTLAADLKEHVVEIIFDKVDGERRIMKATLMRSFLPEDFDLSLLAPEHDVAGRDSMSVWSVDDRGWRAFRMDRVISMQLLVNY